MTFSPPRSVVQLGKLDDHPPADELVERTGRAAALQRLQCSAIDHRLFREVLLARSVFVLVVRIGKLEP